MNLEYLCTAKHLNSRQARCALFFARFNFSLSYRPGSRNNKADTLSRQFDPPENSPEPDFILPAMARLATARLGIEQEVLDSLVDAPAPLTCLTGRLYVPENLRLKVLRWCHASIWSPGVARTRFLLEQWF